MVDWKKEIHLSDLVRRKRPQAAYLSPEAVSSDRDEKTPWWKKEVSLRRKKQAADVAAPVEVEAEAALPEPEPVAEAPVAAVEPEVHDEIPAPPVALEPEPEPEPKEAPAMFSHFEFPVEEPQAPAALSDVEAPAPAQAPQVEDEPVHELAPVYELPAPAEDEHPSVPAAAYEPYAFPVYADDPATEDTFALVPEPFVPAGDVHPEHAPVAAFAPEPEPKLEPEPEPEPVHEPAPAPKLAKPKRQSFSFLRRQKGEGQAAESKKAKRARRKQERGRSKVKKLVGLKVGASQIAAARVSNNGAVELLQLARAPLSGGLVVAGELRDVDGLAAELKTFFRRHKLPKRGIRLGISNNRIGVRVLEIEGIDDRQQLHNAIRFRAQEVLPIPLEDAVLDYQVVEEGETPDGEKLCKVVLVVAYRDLVDRYVAACRKAGLKLVGVDLEAFALLRALGSQMRSEHVDAGLVVVSVGHDRSTFAVSNGEVCEFTRVLDWGGSELDLAIARVLEVSPPDAEPVKRQLSLADSSVVPSGLTPEQAEAARDAVRRQLESFARDLVSSLRFYQSQPGSLSIGEIVVTGGTPQLPGFAEELERLIGVPVRIGDPLGRVKLGKKVKSGGAVGSLAAAIGLGIEV